MSASFLIALGLATMLAPPQAHARPGGWSQSKYAAIVVDANADRVLYSRNADDQRFPASLTKMMTLYMLFAEMRAGRVTASTQIRFSAHAAGQAPSKLGLKVGQTISVRSAILVLVTKSANDVAAAIAEHIGTSESAFAAMMTDRARALGMKSTTFRNASGLPDPRQRSTARDMATLAAALIRDFPDYYDYFKTRSFAYQGHNYRNHNRLLGRVSGVDGIKTGYTHASGYNLAASAQRGSRHLIAIVMGGPSARARDDHVTALLNQQFAKASTAKTKMAHAVTLPAVAPLPAIRPVAAAAPQLASAEPEPAASVKPHLLPAPTPVNPRLLPAAASVAPASGGDPIAEVLAMSQPAEGDDEAEDTAPPSEGDTVIAKVPAAEMQTQQPSHITIVAPMPTPRPRIVPDTKVTNAIAERLREKWLIQIGAYDDEQAARRKLRDAQRKAEILSDRLAYTESVKTDATTLYRARFSSFDKAAAEAACKKLKEAKFPCLPIRQ
ncbi:MAG: serine hydrolase [Hyphomicrobiales bacterium]|nr:serine hydrolase [Hyphomicrobiales bacterium]